MEQGLVHIYCGDGKGKTTCAVGLMIRCAGQGGRVLCFQFLKGDNSGERRILEKLEKVTLMSCYGKVKFTSKMNEEEKEMDVNLTGEEMGLLIGKRGQTLDSLQYLVSLVVNKESEDYLRVKLDTENYRERRKETLETLAKNIAYKVKRTRRPVSLEPMNPYERRIIHSALQNDKYVFTKSEGEDPFRHVVIALKKEERRERRPRYERRERTAGSESSYRNSQE